MPVTTQSETGEPQTNAVHISCHLFHSFRSELSDYIRIQLGMASSCSKDLVVDVRCIQ